MHSASTHEHPLDMKKSRELVTGWGRFAPVMMDIVEPATRDELATVSLDHTLTARGLGRSYGDAAQREGGTAVVTTSCRRCLLYTSPSPRDS